ncbi:dicer-like [Achlya hypogyna]|uniref:Dicer-like n=1 Tax=Achlya hypogyna TaxID=1202772 RepID=A0A1V9YG98_ACHHY|nr:dicer-like [Achlya hypogyna]
MASLRDYQEDVVAAARVENVIMVGSTGIGKTFVSIMLLREQDYSTKRAFVMAPTRQLVYQIHSKILKLTTLKVESYCGHEVEVWDQHKWERELLLNRVLVVTPEILRNLLMKGYITLEKINILIFDECHHTAKRHPYNQIMKLYKGSTSTEKPRVFGTTACPTRDCARNMDAKIKKISMRKEEMSLYAACAPVLHETYPPNMDVGEDMVGDRLNALLAEVDALEVFEYLLTKGNYGATVAEEKRAARVAKFLSDCTGVFQNLGRWCLYKFVELELEKQARRASLKFTTAGNMTGLDPKAILALLVCKAKRDETRFACTPKLDKIAEIVHERLFKHQAPVALDADDDDGELIPCIDDDEATADDDDQDTTDKDNVEDDEDDARLEDAFSDVSSEASGDDSPELEDPDAPAAAADDQLKCVVFVNRRAECRVLADFLNEKFPVPENTDPLFGCMLGQASASDAASYDLPDMNALLKSFESGAARVMVSTSVSCEGVDFPLCAMVICADTIQCPRQFIQVRGRARHSDGVCFYLTDASVVDDAKRFVVLARQAEEIGRLEFGCDKAMTLSKQPLSVIAQQHQFKYTVTHSDQDPTIPSTLQVEATGAVLDLDSSISCLNMYCQSLPLYEKYNLKPEYTFAELLEGKVRRFQVTLALPATLKLPPVVTPFMASKMVGKAIASFRACETLFRLGELDPHLNSVHRHKKMRELSHILDVAESFAVPALKRPKHR